MITQLLDSERLAALVLLRSIAAAQVSRVFYIHPDQLLVRFRHRRLAEFFAGCHMRDNWSLLEKEVALVPWFDPVLNLVCALQRDNPVALQWMAEQTERMRQVDARAWRSRLLSTIEAAGFAGRGETFGRALQVLLDSVLSAAREENMTDDGNKEGGGPDLVTRMAVLYAIEEIGALDGKASKVGLTSQASANEFLPFVSKCQAELRVNALYCLGVIAAITGTRAPVRETAKSWWHGLVAPHAFLTYRRRSPSIALTKTVVASAVGTGELMFIALATLSMVALIMWIGDALSQPGSQTTAMVFGTSAAVVFGLWRGGRFVQDPAKSTSQATLIWRVLGATVYIVGGILTLLGQLLGATLQALVSLLWLIVQNLPAAIRAMTGAIVRVPRTLGMGSYLLMMRVLSIGRRLTWRKLLWSSAKAVGVIASFALAGGVVIGLISLIGAASTGGEGTPTANSSPNEVEPASEVQVARAPSATDGGSDSSVVGLSAADLDAAAQRLRTVGSPIPNTFGNAINDWSNIRRGTRELRSLEKELSRPLREPSDALRLERTALLTAVRDRSKAQETAEARAKEIFLRGVYLSILIVLAAVLVLALVSVIYPRIREKRQRNQLLGIRDAGALCEAISDGTYSEALRRYALSRLLLLDSLAESDIELLESLALDLSRRRRISDRSVARVVAEAVVIAARRAAYRGA